jgi:hypothetical protein
MSRRFPPHRSHYIPKGAVRFADRQSSAVVYAYESQGKLCLMGFHGKAQKPDFHFTYGKSVERREAKAREHFESVRRSEAAAIERREKRKAEGHCLKVGSILRASWGYDQTNIDYFEVTALVGAKMVEIREIAQAAHETGSLVGKCVPLPGAFTGKPMRKLAQGNSVKIYSFAHAYLVEPKMIAGVPTYEASNWTAYA